MGEEASTGRSRRWRAQAVLGRAAARPFPGIAVGGTLARLAEHPMLRASVDAP